MHPKNYLVIDPDLIFSPSDNPITVLIMIGMWMDYVSGVLLAFPIAVDLGVAPTQLAFISRSHYLVPR